jgi:hypothetical protein
MVSGSPFLWDKVLMTTPLHLLRFAKYGLLSQLPISHSVEIPQLIHQLIYKAFFLTLFFLEFPFETLFCFIFP